MPPRIPTSVLPRANPTAEGTEDPPASSISRTFIGSNIINNNSAFAAASLINGIHSSPQQPSLFTTFEEPPTFENGLHYGDSGDEGSKTIGYKERDDQATATMANWLSLVGSLLIIFHIPRVTRHVPSQKKRMLIILFTAFSNTGFSLANIITEYTNAVDKLPCTVSAWCYVFFQLLTCTLVIVGTFRLCGVFIFHRRRSVPSKYIAICPAIAFLLSTPAAISGNFDFDECGHYCWFKLLPDQQDCKVRSLWAWLSFYGWMLLFIAILFASTLFVMVKIILSVTHSRSNLKQVVNQATQESIMADPPPLQSSSSTSTFERLRLMSHSLQTRIASIFSIGGRRRGAAGTTGSVGSAPGRAGVRGIGARTGTGAAPGKSSAENRQEHQQQQPITNFHPNLEGVVLPTLAELAALAAPPPSTDVSLQVPLRDTLEYHGSRSRSISPIIPQSSFPAQEVGILGRKERSFAVAILRQALYPVSISLSGCIQIFVDLTIPKEWDQDDAFSYAATVATSIQGFLFFLVFLFDPAVIQTRREWRKYMVWRYYIEFYYSLEMPHEGREFETRFMQQCHELDPVKDQAKFDQLTRPPFYSWSLQYDSLAMPTDFQTSYPLSAAINATPTNVKAARGMEQGIESTEPIPMTTNRSSQPGGEANGKGSTHTTLPIHTAEVDGTELANPTTFSRPTPTITIIEPTTGGGGKDPMVKTMAEYTRTTSDPTSETSATTTAATNTTTTTTSGTSSTDTDTAATPATNEEIRIHPMSRITALEALDSTYPSASSINTFWDLDILPQNDQVYLDKDMATDRNANARRMMRNQETILKAPYAGDDILSFSRLSKVATIGGGTGGSNGRAPRRYRNPANMMMGSATSHNATADSTTLSRSSAGTAGPINEERLSFGESLLLFIQGGHWHSGMAEERYHTRFRYPRLAYLIHRVVRVVYIPKKARLPPIPNPFARRHSCGVGDLYERPITREHSSVITGMTVQQPPAASCQDITDVPGTEARLSSEYTGLGLDYSSRPRNDGVDCDDFEAYDANDDDDPEQASCSTSPPRGRSRPWETR